MNDGTAERTAGPKPTWRRVVDFPLVAMLIAVVLVVLGLGISGILVQFVIPNIPGFSADMKLDIVALPILLLIYFLVIRRLGDPKRDEFRDPSALRHLGIGLVAGLAVFSLAVLIAAALGIYRIVGMGDLSGMGAALLASAIFPAVSEELLFRGILFRWLEEFGGSWFALFLTSAFFGAVHLGNPNASIVAAVGIAFEAGVMLGAAYMLTRSLWLPMGLHAAWNFTQGEVYDIPVSGMNVHGIVNARLVGPPLLTGNGFGLEASLIAIVIATVFGIYLLWLAIRKGELMQPWWVRRGRMADAIPG
jgi:hypothetical protein